MSLIEICGVLVRARPENVQAVAESLAAMPGVDLYQVNDDGRLVITIERLEDGPRLPDSFAAIHELEGVLAASLVYEHSEPESNETAPRPEPELEQAS